MVTFWINYKSNIKDKYSNGLSLNLIHFSLPLGESKYIYFTFIITTIKFCDFLNIVCSSAISPTGTLETGKKTSSPILVWILEFPGTLGYSSSLGRL